MTDKIIEIKPIRDIINLNFFIPKYQRGYRWTKQEVEDLLNDIADFSPEVTTENDKTWYCLQPLVIKQTENLKQKEKLSYEVIDGQQRLTTIFLIGHYINEMWRGKDKDPEIELAYETRDTEKANSNIFLTKLSVNKNNEVDVNAENIDFYHISKAYETIHNWIINKKNNNFIKDNFIDKFLNDTKVIWYETTETDTISIFTRINIGKIPLTSAELIKARFLNSSNFNKKEQVELIQLQIASEWDNIEYSLQNQKLWHFINEEENNIETRIEFILDLISGKTDKTDKNYTFKHFDKKFKNNSEKEIKKNWKEIKLYFQTIEEWFNDRELYHKIGFLISCSIKINKLYSISEKMTKIEFKEELNKKISKQIPNNIEDLSYKDRIKIRKVLLLFNIQTMLNNELESSRFPFDRYKNEKWDIEHIHSVQEDIPKLEKHQKDWLKNARQFIEKPDNLIQQIDHFIEDFESSDFEKLYLKILDYFSENKKHDDINDISNLCLLDFKTNRGYGNDIFPVKREKIIEKDKTGTFIPICTKNVFLKYFSSNVSQMTFWGEKERNDYINNIKKTLKPYLN